MIHLHRQGNGRPLVFFHGWGFDGRIWEVLTPHLADDFEMIMVDLPGFGQSASMEWDAFKAQLLTQLPERFAVVGWSLGGLFATRLAFEAGDRVTHLMNVTSSPKFIGTEGWSGVSEALLHTFYQNVIADPKQSITDFIALQARTTAIDPHHVPEPAEEALLSGLSMLQEWDLRPSLHKLKQPVAYVFGRLDPITPVAVMSDLQRLHPQFKYVLFHRAAHMPFLSHPEDFVQELRDFL